MASTTKKNKKNKTFFKYNEYDPANLKISGLEQGSYIDNDGKEQPFDKINLFYSHPIKNDAGEIIRYSEGNLIHQTPIEPSQQVTLKNVKWSKGKLTGILSLGPNDSPDYVHFRDTLHEDLGKLIYAHTKTMPPPYKYFDPDSESERDREMFRNKFIFNPEYDNYADFVTIASFTGNEDHDFYRKGEQVVIAKITDAEGNEEILDQETGKMVKLIDVLTCPGVSAKAIIVFEHEDIYFGVAAARARGAIRSVIVTDITKQKYNPQQATINELKELDPDAVSRVASAIGALSFMENGCDEDVQVTELNEGFNNVEDETKIESPRKSRETSPIDDSETDPEPIIDNPIRRTVPPRVPPSESPIRASSRSSRLNLGKPNFEGLS